MSAHSERPNTSQTSDTRSIGTWTMVTKKDISCHVIKAAHKNLSLRVNDAIQTRNRFNATTDFLETKASSCVKDNGLKRVGWLDLAYEVKTAPCCLWVERMRWCYAKPIKIPNKRVWWMTSPPDVTRGERDVQWDLKNHFDVILHVESHRADVAEKPYSLFHHGSADSWHRLTFTRVSFTVKCSIRKPFIYRWFKKWAFVLNVFLIYLHST